MLISIGIHKLMSRCPTCFPFSHSFALECCAKFNPHNSCPHISAPQLIQPTLQTHRYPALQTPQQQGTQSLEPLVQASQQKGCTAIAYGTNAANALSAELGRPKAAHPLPTRTNARSASSTWHISTGGGPCVSTWEIRQSFCLSNENSGRHPSHSAVEGVHRW